ncbi:nucleosome assembly protein 1-like 1 [Mustela lutreola]|uniref:nucleosome assembly protein 1-like 1 n=1 Tax=Mustela lutreola TaxID=9666 RepID=UPI0027977072|nr:nucleosome assembly protein 1-like 1 [Mustela lutreola]XP_059013581.1 nucleosome assembly protein 1-like 1 [Mustela lutreola]
MSATEEQSLIPGGQDPRPVGVPVSPSEGVDGVEAAAAFLASEGVARALPEEEGGQDAAQAAEQSQEGKLVEEEEAGEEAEEEEEEEEFEFEFEFGDQEDYEYQSPEFEFEFGNQEESDYESEEEGENEEENEEEEEETEQEEDNGQGPADVPEVATAAPETLMARFRSLFRALLHSLLHRIHDNDHVLVQPHAGRMGIRRHSREPEDPGERPAPPEVEEPGEGPAPQDQGHPREEAEVRVGEYQAEGASPWGPQEPTEEAVSQKAEEPTAEAHGKEDEALGDASKSSEAGACAPDKVQVGEWPSSPRALAAPLGAPSSKAGGAQHLPLAVKQRVKALKNLQAQYAQVEAQFYRDFHDLEKKYAVFYQPLFDKRSEIVNAIYEPTEGECQWQVAVQEGAWGGMEREPAGKGPTSGIPHFWLTAFKNVKILGRMIRKNDEPVLEHLKDVKIKFSGFKEPMSFTIEFIFKSNEYFLNEILTKTYQMRSDPDNSDPFLSKGPEIISSTGCEIYWKEGRNVTMKTSKLQKCEDRRSIVSTTKKTPRYSFFTYFYPPDSPEGRVVDVATDFRLGYFFREVLVPKSVLFFTNEASEYKCGSSDDEAREAGGEEKKAEEIRNEEPEKGPEKHLGPGESSS